ncbi:glycogen debranching protein GlgX [Candidatus Magnetoovum chiemensis]|nr:glycogen debranching protein GlgX [Candidatus Magnetoovum chiemensis]
MDKNMESEERKHGILDVFDTEEYGQIKLFRGRAEPLGSIVKREGVNFAIFSEHATSVTLLLFTAGEGRQFVEIPLDPYYNKTGDIWHIYIKGLKAGVRYGYKMDRENNHQKQIHRYNKDTVLIDPYAKALTGGFEWNKLYRRRKEDIGQVVNVRRSLVIEDDFDWLNDKPLNIPFKDSVIYELHVRGFTIHNSSKINHPGTFKGLIEKIPYLKELGVTAIELIPINEFEEMDSDRVNPLTNERLLNFWGYQPISFFCPKASYSSNGREGNQIREFKDMVKTMHDNAIEVILDVVFNHTSEGNEKGPAYCYRGIDNQIYYIIDPITGAYHNYTGCGNTLNCNHPVVRNMIIDCLRYWVMDMHVDGFRFDLASILGRGRDGSVLKNPPIIESIAADPILANTKLIAEAWDAAGLYQVGTFPHWGRWAEWNGKYRDDIRKFVRSDPGMIPDLAKRLAGSPDLYKLGGRDPFHSVNFITCHDGFTLADLVSYNEKHNESNGENNQDGCNDNYSWNCGKEGYTTSQSMNTLRSKQMKNFAVILFLSHGVPMILAGDEMGRSQRGNNNAYCQDNEISWLNWDMVRTNEDLFKFFKLLIQFRKKHSSLRPVSFEEAQDETWPPKWNGIEPGKPDWSWGSRSLAMFVSGRGEDNDIYLILNAYWEALRFKLPTAKGNRKWYRFIDTDAGTSNEITEIGQEILIGNQRYYNVGARSTVVLISK